MEICWRFYNDTSWSDIAVVPNAPSRPAGPQIAIDTRDSLQVVFSGDAENNRDIFYTQRGPSGVKPQPWLPFPQGYKLEQSYPNPFNPTTVIRYQSSVIRPVHTTLKIYNILGEEVITLVDQEQRVGRYQVVWDGRNNQGKEVTSGVYLYRLKAGEFTAARKMVLLR